MPRKLNDTQIAELVLKYSNGTSISALSREYGIARPSVTRYLKENADLLQQCASKKCETVTEWLKANSDRIQDLLTQCIDLLPKQLEKANARDLVGAIKILTETSIDNIEIKHG